MKKTLVVAAIVAAAVALGGAGAVVALPVALAQSFPTPAETVGPPVTNDRVLTTKPAIASITDGRAPSDDEAIAFLRADVADFVRVDATVVRRATVGELKAVVGDDGLPIGYDDSLPVLLVTGVGVFRPSYTTTGETFGWGTMVIDATDGGLIGTFGQPGNPPALLIPQP